MYIPLNLSDISLWLAVTAVILLITSELMYSVPDFAARVPVDKSVLRMIALGCGLGFSVTVVMRILGFL
jgi:hypothetical protein